MSKEAYIGDAVYIRLNEFDLEIFTGDGNNQRIFLEPEVLVNMLKTIENWKLCPGCLARGFEKSKLSPYRCGFCDGTIGGQTGEA